MTRIVSVAFALICVLLLPAVAAAQTAPPPERPVSLKLAISLYTFGQVADVATTRMALNRGLHEGNPWMQWATDTTGRHALVKGTVTAAMAVVLWKAYPEKPKETKVIAWVVTGMQLAVVAWNVHQLHKQGRR
jgi:hypothetical protein